MVEPTESESAFGGGYEFEAVAACPTRVASSIAGSLTPEARRWEASAPGSSGRWSRARERRRSAGCCSSPRSGWVSTLGTGFRSLVAVESAPAQRTRCSACSPLSRRRGGGFGTRCRGRVGETSTRWRSRPAGWPSRSRRRPGRTMVAISLGCGSRWPGCRGAGEDGHETVPLQSCALFVCGASSGSSTASLWCPSTGWRMSFASRRGCVHGHLTQLIRRCEATAARPGSTLVIDDRHQLPDV